MLRGTKLLGVAVPVHKFQNKGCSSADCNTKAVILLTIHCFINKLSTKDVKTNGLFFGVLVWADCEAIQTQTLVEVGIVTYQYGF